MFCEKCGQHIDDSLNFCKSCGKRIKKEKDEGRSIINTLISALIAVAVVGLAMLIGLTAILLDKSPNVEPVFVFAVIYLAVLFGICFMITRQISKMIDKRFNAEEKTIKTLRSEEPLVQLPPSITNPLEEFRQPPSVTDSTTRTLDKVPIKRR